MNDKNENTILMGCKFLELNKNSLICGWGQSHLEKSLQEETYRTNFRRQRDRILYTGGFRRLQDKTQVISAMKSGDHRTRLTHTLEVEQIAISISDALGLNSDLVSAIAMGHDVGHTPFGHAVERVLNEKLKDKGGFSHAVQSIKYLNEKIVKAASSEDEEAVNKLQDIIFEGILKHDTDIYAGAYDSQQWDCDKYRITEAGTLEMQVVYWADKLAYLTHDCEDFYNTEIYFNAKKDAPELQKELQQIVANLIFEKTEIIMEDFDKFETRDLIRNVISKLLDQSKLNIENHKEFDSEQMRNHTTKRIKEIEKNLARKKENDIEIEFLDIEYIKELNLSIENEENENEKEIKKQLLKKIQKIKKDSFMDGLIINFDDNYRKYYIKLRTLLDDRYIRSPEITRSDAKAAKIASSLYNDFVENPKLLPWNIQSLIKNDSNAAGKYVKERVVADYIASMTDRYAELVYTDLNAIGGHYEY